MIATTAKRVRAIVAGLAWGLFALYFLMLVVWGSQPDVRGHLVAAIGIVIASVAGVMALGLPRVLLFLAIVLLAATLIYMGIGLSPLVPFFTFSDASMVDGAGHVWLIHHIAGVSALLGFCTMGLVSVVALGKLRRSFH